MSDTIQVLVFGPQADAIRASYVSVSLSLPTTAKTLHTSIAESCPALAGSLGSSRIAVNHAFAEDSTPIGAGDEVALIGPVSGG